MIFKASITVARRLIPRWKPMLRKIVAGLVLLFLSGTMPTITQAQQPADKPLAGEEW